MKGDDRWLFRSVSIFHFSVNLNSGYYQISIGEEDMHKTVMRSLYGSNKVLVILFGLYNALPMFMFIINKISHEEIDQYLHINDRLVFFSEIGDENVHIHKLLAM